MRTAAFLLTIFTCAPCVGQPWSDLADVPVELRQKNWLHQGEGSCAHASTIVALRWINLPEMADWWKTNYGGGEYFSRLTERMDSAGLRYVATEDGDFRVLEYAARNRLVVVLPYKPAHAINLVDLTPTHAVLLDNNRPGEYEYVPRAEFDARWTQEFGGVAICLIGTPAPPWPTQ